MNDTRLTEEKIRATKWLKTPGGIHVLALDDRTWTLEIRRGGHWILDCSPGLPHLPMRVDGVRAGKERAMDEAVKQFKREQVAASVHPVTYEIAIAAGAKAKAASEARYKLSLALHEAEKALNVAHEAAEAAHKELIALVGEANAGYYISHALGG